jgi:hypothetical protein
MTSENSIKMEKRNMEIEKYTDNDISITNDVITLLKESIKFSLIALVIFLIIGTSVAYILLEFVGASVDVAGILDGIVTAVFVVIIDFKKLHITDKMAECNRRIFKKVLKKILKMWIRTVQF